MKPGIYPDLTLQEYLQIDAIHSSGLRMMGHGPRAYWHSRRQPPTATPAMRAGSLAHIQILDPQAYLRRVVEWTEPVYEPLPALQWQKVSADRYVTECGRYQLDKADGWWSTHPQKAEPIIEQSTIPAAKAACKAHYEATTARQPKLDDDGRPKLAPRNEASAAYSSFLRANPGREVVTRDELAKAAAIAAAVRDNPEARRLLGERWRTELTLVWVHAETGALCKARLDWLSDPHEPPVTIGDLKLTKSIDARRFAQAAAGYEYHAQLAWYGDGLCACFPGLQLLQAEPSTPRLGPGVRTGPRLGDIMPVLLAVESGGSHDCTVFDVGAVEIELGRTINEERLREILAYRKSHSDRPWPGRCERTVLDFAEHCPRLFRDEKNEVNWDELDEE